MGLTLQNLRDGVRTHLGVGSEVTNTVIDDYINRSWWEIQAKFKFREKDVAAEQITEEGNNTYELPEGFDYVERLAYVDSNSDLQQLKQLDLDSAIQISTDSEDARGEPKFYSRRLNFFILYPTPDDAYTIKIFYKETLADVIDSGPSIPQEWHEIIMFGAVARGHLALGATLKHTYFSNLVASSIQSLIPVETKETDDTRYAQVQMLRPRYP